MDKYSAHNSMNSNRRNFPQTLDGNSVRMNIRPNAEDRSAAGGKFRVRCGDFFRSQPIEITEDDFSAMPENKVKSELIFTAPREPGGLEVKLGLNRVIRKGRNCSMRHNLWRMQWSH